MQASRTVVGVDTAKRVFQLHWVELETCEMNRAACGGAQHWARRLLARATRCVWYR